MAETIDVELRQVTKQFGRFTAVDNVSLKIERGEFFALLGPSGCGKTTTLRLIAGFELPTQGEVMLNGEPVGQLPPFKRNVNTVFQSYALFPHLTVEENVAFGLEMKKVDRKEAARRVGDALDLVRLPDIGHRRPHQLSGGQRQRVALARAIVNRPRVLLLDEPLGALDLKLRKAMQLELKELQRQLDITFIFVTHDQEEALVMSDRIGVMNEGELLQIGRPSEIYDQPNSRFVADFIGDTNFIPCRVESCDDGLAQVAIGDNLLVNAMSATAVSAGQEATLAIRPEKIHLQKIGDEVYHDEANFTGVVEDAVFLGTDTLFKVRLAPDVLVEVLYQNENAIFAELDFGKGDTIGVSWMSSSARVLTI